MSFRK